eukprot:jgi/Phyca11/130679/e_gw1.96.121.1
MKRRRGVDANGQAGEASTGAALQRWRLSVRDNEASGVPLTLLDVCDIFDALVVKHPIGIKYLTADASIDKNGARSGHGQAKRRHRTQGFAEQVLLHQTQRTARKYFRGVRYISPTSNNIERLFSVAKHALSLHRHGMLPIHLETALFSKLNRRFWKAAIVVKVNHA